MKPYHALLRSIDREFEKALASLKSDPLFTSNRKVYTADDKARIAHLWKDIATPFRRLRKMIQSIYWRSFFTFGSKNSFVVQYAAVTTYYNMVYELQQSFGDHEEFLRQYLDDTFSENYSTIARYMYHIRFYSILLYPREYFLTLKDEVDRSLAPIFERPERASWTIEKRWVHDMANIWYYIRYRIGLLFTWIAKYGGRLMLHIRLSRREHWLITPENVEKLLPIMKPWDILLTRGNWAATNMNIPWFWKHMAMYIWTWKSLKKKYNLSSKLNLDDEEHYIIEAIWVWVQIISLKALCGHNDYLGVIRPAFSSEKKERVLTKILSLIGKEYDYSFNYYSDVNYVCSTLVTKVYLPESEFDEWIHITLTRIGISITYPPNDIVKKMISDKENGIHELDFVGFIDSIDRKWENFLSTEEGFISTAVRPKLSFFLP